MPTANPHLEVALQWFGHPPEHARVGLIALHGRGHTPQVFKELVLDRLDLDQVCVVAPAASGNTWYPRRFMEPGVEADEAVLHARAAVRRASGALVERGLPVTAQVLTGFSQGACLACEYVFRERPPLAGLVAFTGGLLGGPGMTWPMPTRAFEGFPVRLGGSEADVWVPSVRVRETAEVFRAGGADVAMSFREGDEHGVSDEELEPLRALLAR
jgi:phospholipase/carboxylesterase